MREREGSMQREESAPEKGIVPSTPKEMLDELTHLDPEQIASAIDTLLDERSELVKIPDAASTDRIVRIDERLTQLRLMLEANRKLKQWKDLAGEPAGGRGRRGSAKHGRTPERQAEEQERYDLLREIRSRKDVLYGCGKRIARENEELLQQRPKELSPDSIILLETYRKVKIPTREEEERRFSGWSTKQLSTYYADLARDLFHLEKLSAELAELRRKRAQNLSDRGPIKP